MVTGIVTWIAISIIITFILTWVMRIVKLQGYNQGCMDEARHWIAAVNKVTVPNWQSLPPQPGNADPERQKLAAQIYVTAYKCALDVIKEEIAMNRLEAMVDDLKKFVAEEQPRYPIA